MKGIEPIVAGQVYKKTYFHKFLSSWWHLKAKNLAIGGV